MNIPTLLVHDVEDKLIPIGHAESLVRALAFAQLLHTSALGHRRALADAGVPDKW